jgi:glycosyltransferase involved in cell wall biosynthesis
MPYPLTFWQNIPSIHQAPLIREMAKCWEGPVRVVAEEDIPDRRLEQGWRMLDFGEADLIVSPALKTRTSLIKDGSSKDAFHLFSGITAYPKTYWSLKQLSASEAVLGTMVEAGRDTDGIKTIFRKLRHRHTAWKWRNRIDLILPTGEVGCAWWRSAGFPSNKIKPFGYFVHHPGKDLNPFDGSRAADGFRMIYVGQLISRKGLDLLVQAMAMVHEEKCVLDIIGDGPEAHLYKDLSEKSGLNDRIRWHGPIPNEKVLKQIVEADLLVLPSRFDGWGAVVNEALTVGTPVLASDKCGASCLLTSSVLGEVFPSGNNRALASVLKARMAKGPITRGQRMRIKEWAKHAISPEVAANYLRNILLQTKNGHYQDLRPPWATTKA